MNEKTATSGCLVALMGAAIANLVVIAGVFALGAFFGASQPSFSAVGAQQPAKHGLEGGETAVGALLVVYIFTIGLVPLIVTSIGAVIALVARWVLSKKTPVRP